VPAASTQIAIPFALAGGSWIFLGFVVVMFFALVFGYYTRRGSGINQTPYRNPGGPPESPSELTHDTTQKLSTWERGTAGHHRTRPLGTANQPPEAIARALADWRTGPSSAQTLDPPIGQTDHVRGPDEAPTLAIYLDVSSEPSRSAYTLLSDLAGAHQVRLAVRQLPLADVHPLSLVAAEALEAAAAQGRFFTLFDQLVSTGVTAEAQLVDGASRCVEDPDRLRLEVGAGTYQPSVVGQINQARTSGVHSVPELYINGRQHRGPIGKDEIARALRKL
jgi:hypothetical protein